MLENLLSALRDNDAMDAVACLLGELVDELQLILDRVIL